VRIEQTAPASEAPVGDVGGGRRRALSTPAMVERRRWWALAVLCLSVIITGLDNSILNVALPSLARPTSGGGLGAAEGDLQWIVDAYTLVFAGLLLWAGSLGDRFGRYGALTVGLVVFGLASVFGTVAGSPGQLIAARAAMGVGGALIMPATLSILANVFLDPTERGWAIGIWAASAAVGLGLGPVGGGLLLEHFWWGSVLLVNVPIVAFALVAGWLVLPTSKDPTAPRLDPLGAVLSILGFGALLWAVIEGPSAGWTSAEVLTGFASAVALLGAFVGWELRTDHPMLDVRLFRLPRFSVASAAITVAFMTLSGMVFLLTQYLQSVRGYTPLKAGLLTLGFAIGMVVMSPLSARQAERRGTTTVVAGGLGLVAASMLGVLALGPTSPPWLPALIALLVAMGMGTIMAPATESIMGALPRSKAGVGSAVNDATRQIGAAVGVALFGSLHATRYRTVVETRLDGHVPADTLQEVTHNVQHALAAGRATPPPQGARIIDAAADGFVSGFHLAVGVGALVIALAVAIVVRFLPARAPRPGGDPIAAAGPGSAAPCPGELS